MTERLAGAWGAEELPLEKDFSPTLAGDPLADERPRVLRWLREVPGRIRTGAGATKVRLAVKLMNARFDESFQLEMLDACGAADSRIQASRCDTMSAGGFAVSMPGSSPSRSSSALSRLRAWTAGVQPSSAAEST